jgi:hypothetical protein
MRTQTLLLTTFAVLLGGALLAPDAQAQKGHGYDKPFRAPTTIKPPPPPPQVRVPHGCTRWRWCRPSRQL